MTFYKRLSALSKSGRNLLALKRRIWTPTCRHYSKCGPDGEPTRGLVIGVYETEGDRDPKLTKAGEKIDDRMSGKLMELIKENNIHGYLGKGKVFNNVGDEFFAIATIGLGKEGLGYCDYENLDAGMENVRVAAGVGARALQMQCCTEVFIDPMGYAEQAAEGSALAVWRYHTNKRKRDRARTPKLDMFESSDIDAWTRGLFKAEAQNLARRLTDTPANQMTPTIFAQAAVDALCPCGVTVEVRALDWIELNQLNSFLMIAKGSCEPPLVLEITYCGASPGDKPILLLGKGISFNSGGLSLREKKGMDEFRGSLAGAAVCVAAIRASAALSLPVNVTAIIPLCENMPSGMACKPGDVVTLLNGKTMGIRNLSKAGVVVMADPLIYAQATYKPKLVVDIATLGSGVRRGLGESASGVFTSSSYVYRLLRKAGAISGDRVWRLPLWKYFKTLVNRNPTYDISNDGSGPACSCLAAAILHQLVPCSDWVHIDIRGTGMLTTHNPLPYLLKGRMTGRPTRTIIQFLYQMACDESK